MIDHTLQGKVNPEGKKELNANDIDEMRKSLVAQYGSKIIGKPKSSWTAKEKAAHIIYKTLTESLYKLAPDAKLPDQISQLYTRNEVDSVFGLLWKYVVKIFWIILAIAVLLALLKFVFS